MFPLILISSVEGSLLPLQLLHLIQHINDLVLVVLWIFILLLQPGLKSHQLRPILLLLLDHFLKRPQFLVFFLELRSINLNHVWDKAAPGVRAVVFFYCIFLCRLPIAFDVLDGRIDDFS